MKMETISRSDHIYINVLMHSTSKRHWLVTTSFRSNSIRIALRSVASMCQWMSTETNTQGVRAIFDEYKTACRKNLDNLRVPWVVARARAKNVQTSFCNIIAAHSLDVFEQ